MKELIEKLQAELAGLTKTIEEKSAKGLEAEVAELSGKVVALSKELGEKKHQFDVAQQMFAKPDVAERKAIDAKLDELFIAQALLTRKDGTTDRAKLAEVANLGDYRTALKASGFTNDPTVPDGLVSGGDGTPAHFGSDLVVPGFSSTLLEEIFLKLQVADLFPRFNMPNATYTFPFATGRLTARRGLEGRAVTKDKFATNNLQFVAKKLMSVVDFTDELEADAIIPVLGLIRERLIEGFALAQEQIVINGDVDIESTGINGALADAEDARGVAKGIRCIALADGCKVDFAGNKVTDTGLRDMRAAMGKYGLAPSELAYVISIAQYNHILKTFTNYQALHTYGAGAVILKGELGRLDNIPLIITELLPENLAATGKYDVAGTKSTLALVNKKGLMWGDRAGFALETFRNPLTQQTSLIGSQRLDLQKITVGDAKPLCVGVNVG